MQCGEETELDSSKKWRGLAHRFSYCAVCRLKGRQTARQGDEAR